MDRYEPTARSRLSRALSGWIGPRAKRPTRTTASKTRVWITVDSEPSPRYENGCWDYCVNGVWPRDLERWYQRGIARKTDRGYRLVPTANNGLREMYGDVTAPERVLDAGAVEARIDNAQAGLPLLFSVLRQYGVTATCFLDAAQLYIYGGRFFREACDLIELSGNDLQLHLHPESLFDDWYAARGLVVPSATTEMRPKSELVPLLKCIAADFRAFAAVPPIAYRAGAYRISPDMIDSLVEIGIKLDSSFDILNKKGHVQLDREDMRGNFPVPYRGLLEVPISAYTIAAKDRVMRFTPRHRKPQIDALIAMREAGVPVITYILHSPGLMNVYGEGDDERVGRLGPDDRLIENFRAELAFIARDPGFEFVNGAAGLLAVQDELLNAPFTVREVVM